MNGTVDVDREVTDYEQRALVTVEVAERLAYKALALILKTNSPSPLDLAQARYYLQALTDETLTRTCTNVKQQGLSDSISAKAKETYLPHLLAAQHVACGVRQPAGSEEGLGNSWSPGCINKPGHEGTHRNYDGTEWF